MIAPAPKLELSLAADLAAPSLGRGRLGTWLAEIGWPPAETGTLLLAAGEAMANAVEHAYPDHANGQVHLTAEEHFHPDGHHHVVLTVSDTGNWRPIPADPGNRGHGLKLIRAFTATTTIEATPAGTRVTMTSHPQPRPPTTDPETSNGTDCTTSHF